MRHWGHVLNQVRTEPRCSETGIKTVLLWWALALSNRDDNERCYWGQGRPLIIHEASEWNYRSPNLANFVALTLAVRYLMSTPIAARLAVARFARG
jgi:hypothetical protein